MDELKIENAMQLYVDGMSINNASKKANVARTTLQRRLQIGGLSRKYTQRIKKDVKDLRGFMFGKLTAIKLVIEDEGRVLWICECECGTREKIRLSRLESGEKECCGNCLMTGVGNHAWKGCGKLSGTYWKRLKANAKRRANGPIKFNITIEYAWNLYNEQNGLCALTGLSIPFPKRVKDGFVASLDRIDSSLGYIKDNVQWVHKDVNTMKWDFKESYFINMCKNVVKHKGVYNV